MNTTDLKMLKLNDCTILLASIVKDSTVMNTLSLKNRENDDLGMDLGLCPDKIDDNCIDILCESLANNSVLTNLELSKSEEITDDGWKSFEKFLFDSTSLDFIYQSNHALHSIEGNPRSNKGTFTVKELTLSVPCFGSILFNTIQDLDSFLKKLCKVQQILHG